MREKISTVASFNSKYILYIGEFKEKIIYWRSKRLDAERGNFLMIAYLIM
jgi:hypothetical protein